MKFRIYRTSTCWKDDPPKPCEGTVHVTDPSYTYKTKVPYYFHPYEYELKSDWEETTTVECGHWEIEINTLEELLALAKNTDEKLIVSEDQIEIYDSWRE